MDPKLKVLMRAFALLLASILVFALAGCASSSSSDTSTSSTSSTGTAGATTPGAATGGSAPGGQIVAPSSDIPMPPTITVKEVGQSATKYADADAVNWEFKANDETPGFFKDALAKKKPVFVEFYGDYDGVSDSMTAAVEALKAKYNTQVIFILLNVDRPQTYGTLADQLPIRYTPQFFIFNKSSTIVRQYQGYSDQKRLEQGIFDAISRGY